MKRVCLKRFPVPSSRKELLEYNAFTIVELLVVIAILAVISLVAYGRVRQGVVTAQIQSDLANA